jgi:hypothetical protein
MRAFERYRNDWSLPGSPTLPIAEKHQMPQVCRSFLADGFQTGADIAHSKDVNQSITGPAIVHKS